MNRLISLLLFTAVIAAISGCGIKGPLYLPEEAESKPAAELSN